jgi:hypothetical protein
MTPFSEAITQSAEYESGYGTILILQEKGRAESRVRSEVVDVGVRIETGLANESRESNCGLN